jgi:hypothetical protein
MDDFSKLYFPRDRIKALLLLILVGLIYLPFLGSPLVFDDVPFFKNTIVNFSDAPFSFNLRWFPYFSFGFTWAFFGENPYIFRVQNMLLHGMNVLLLLLVLRLWISLFIEECARQKMANWGAWLGALVFACHPLAVYGTAYLVQRSILMATLFTLVMHLAYFRGLISGKKRYAALAVAGYFLAVFSKEHSLMVPTILLPLTWVLRAQIKLSRRELFVTWVGFFVSALIVMMRVKGILGDTYEKDAVDLIGQTEMLKGLSMLHLLSALTQAGLFFKYSLLMLIPNPAWMSIDMRETFLLSWQEWTSWIGFVAFISYGLAAFIFLLRGGRIALLGLALLYPWLLFMTEFSTIRVQEIFVLYRAYLWLPGLMLLLPVMFSTVSEKKIIWVGGVTVLLFLPLAWNRLWVMADNYRLWDDAVQLLHGENRLGSQRTYYGRAYAAAEKKDWEKANNDYEKSLSINPSSVQVHLALAKNLVNAGKHQEALQEFSKIVVSDSKNSEAHLGMAMTYKNMKNEAGATAELKVACELGSNLACAIVSVNRLR